ncbi:hypothetical protein Hypma_009524 [Hypsizygus marmoreus]|uniref:Uncharacterized protein n=1 Tax=Hypsizygus marmoreus TaxID=39966 RepID=A0A369JVE1_HYPMA|nr:hypothetical protein Hypma_009524 [Hypsizygus marmoreus]
MEYVAFQGAFQQHALPTLLPERVHDIPRLTSQNFQSLPWLTDTLWKTSDLTQLDDKSGNLKASTLIPYWADRDLMTAL